MKEIIITGATGFIGRRLIKEIINFYPKEKILCLIRDRIDDLESSGREILRELKVDIKEIDLPSGRGLDDLPKNAKLIIHLAASTESGDTDHSCNDIGTKNLLDALSPIHPSAKVIFTSTAAVYSGRKDLDNFIDQNTKAISSNEYGRSKLRAEETLKEYSLKSGCTVTVFRLATVWGDGTRKNGLFDAMKKLISKRSVIPRLNWPGKTSLIHVDNVVQIMIYFASKKIKEQFEIFILSHEGLTLADISRVLHRKFNTEYKAIILPRFFWYVSNLIVNNSNHLEKALPSKIYNNLWRLNLIVNDSLYCMPDEIKNRVPELKLNMIKYE